MKILLTILMLVVSPLSIASYHGGDSGSGGSSSGSSSGGGYGSGGGSAAAGLLLIGGVVYFYQRNKANETDEADSLSFLNKRNSFTDRLELNFNKANNYPTNMFGFTGNNLDLPGNNFQMTLKFKLN